MRFKRHARLIQDIGEYRNIIEQYLCQAFVELGFGWPTRQQFNDLLQWTIAEQLEECRYLYSRCHNRFHPLLRALYCTARNLMEDHHEVGMDLLSSNYIKSPIVYGDDVIDVELHGQDLTIHYYADPIYHTPPSLTNQQHIHDIAKTRSRNRST